MPVQVMYMCTLHVCTCNCSLESLDGSIHVKAARDLQLRSVHGAFSAHAQRQVTIQSTRQNVSKCSSTHCPRIYMYKYV